MSTRGRPILYRVSSMDFMDSGLVAEDVIITSMTGNGQIIRSLSTSVKRRRESSTPDASGKAQRISQGRIGRRETITPRIRATRTVVSAQKDIGTQILSRVGADQDTARAFKRDVKPRGDSHAVQASTHVSKQEVKSRMDSDIVKDLLDMGVPEKDIKKAIKKKLKLDVAEKITAAMNSEIVKAVLEMDVPEPRIRETIKKQLEENGAEFHNVEDLLQAIFSPDLEVQECPEGATGGASLEVNRDTLKLMEENRLLKEQKQCKICMEGDACMVFLPCGHLITCSTCASVVRQCPICRQKIKKTVRAFLS
ncbi:baculoviral IAP repeat-containing protein 2-like isoform X3 [Biomphalaria glabrata]|uniref:Baculoviral IAP repeat-containing protein 2-like isoform X3 n=1 Tax=Biomphalaria glabrata TaxID=6526 RepID=A0A9W3AS94_BIOGL|nr:baculoviral IAP repeat-containing protein 2-like isoform X3 [Biomphalaria glabrata]